MARNETPAWRWIRADLAWAVHESQLARHGGLDGIRDQNAVAPALARPQQMDIPAPRRFVSSHHALPLAIAHPQR